MSSLSARRLAALQRPRRKRLAITMAGAVSLGSYEAGVIYEVITALGEHNASAAEADRFEIDVLTGASAGGMTAAIVAQKLLYEAGSLRSPADNPFHRPWVDLVDIMGLLAVSPGESARESIFSSDAIEAVSRALLTQRYADSPGGTGRGAPVRDRHPVAAETIRLGLALSNLNGVDYSVPLRPRGDFTYTRHADRFERVFHAGGSDGGDTFEAWEEVRRAAVACGAFPFAFRAQDLRRRSEEYTDPDVVPMSGESREYAYTDGGVFQNEPLGLAKQLVNRIDDHAQNDQRFYLFISPGARHSTADSQFQAKGADFVKFGGRLMAAVVDQAQFQDWITAEGVNDDLARFNARATALKEALLGGQVTAGQLAASAAPLMTALFASRRVAVDDTLDAARERVRHQFAEEVSELEGRGFAGAEANAWIDVVLAIETAAELGPRDEMRIYAIHSPPGQLASADLLAFQGFFDRAYRQHDFDVGRLAARDFVQRVNESGDPLGPVRPGPIQTPIRLARGPDGQPLEGLTLERVDAGRRRLVARRLEARADQALRELGVPGAVRWAFRRLVLERQIERLLKL